jgi:hypothetical protein
MCCDWAFTYENGFLERVMRNLAGICATAHRAVATALVLNSHHRVKDES